MKTYLPDSIKASIKESSVLVLFSDSLVLVSVLVANSVILTLVWNRQVLVLVFRFWCYI